VLEKPARHMYKLLLPVELKKFPEYSQSGEWCRRSRNDLEVENSGCITSFGGI
jgi:hypothetical protein